MSNDLELPNNANKVLRTYSNNYSDPSSPQRGDMHNNSMHTIKHLTKEEKEELVMQMSVAQSVSIPMPGQMER